MLLKTMRFQLKKLPIWGKNVTMQEESFAWPDSMMCQGMSSDVYLNSIEISTYYGHSDRISAVQGTLSSGQISPLFKTEGTEVRKTLRIELT